VIVSEGERHDLLVWGGKSIPVDWHEASISFHEMSKLKEIMKNCERLCFSALLKAWYIGSQK
jgi:hypothetical protein